MRAADLITSAMEHRGKTQKEMAVVLNHKTVTFHKRIAENALKAQEFLDAADYLGYRVTLVDKETEAKVEPVRKGVGPRVRKRIDCEVYDTAKAEPICHTPYENGWMLELFKDSEGRYFAAHHTEWDGIKSYITLVPDKEAEKLIEEFGE